VADTFCYGERERTVASSYLDEDTLRVQVPLEHPELASEATGIPMPLRM